MTKKYEIYKDEEKVKPHNADEKSNYPWIFKNHKNNTDAHFATYQEAIEEMNGWESEPDFLG